MSESSVEENMDIGPMRSEWSKSTGDWFLLQSGTRMAQSGEVEPVIMATFLRMGGEITVNMVFTLAEATFLETALRRMNR